MKKITERLSRANEPISHETRPFTFSDISRKSLLVANSTRANAVWKMASVVIASFDNNTSKTTADYLAGWKRVAHSDQTLILGITDTDWEVYDSSCNLLGDNTYLEQFLNRQEAIGDITPTIYYGVPGSGKTYYVQNYIYRIFADDDRFMTTMHQSYCYEDFVEGLKPKLNVNPIEYEVRKGVFWAAAERAAILAGYTNMEACINATPTDRRQKFLQAITENKIVCLVLDEINRANVSSVFGELISLIEISKRLGSDNEMIVTVPYSQDKFGVPLNLFVVGTMNTADRSIQLIDTALRRRFKFKEVVPDYKKLEDAGCPNSSIILKKLNQKLRVLLDSDHQIGHSYFINTKDDNLAIFKVLKDAIIPLLQEYFYGNIDKIRLVLGETTESPHNFYVKDKEANEVYNTISDADDENKEFYMLNEELNIVDDSTKAKLYLQNLLP